MTDLPRGLEREGSQASLPPGLERRRVRTVSADPSLLRQPARLVLAGGALAVIVASLLPWAVGRDPVVATPVAHGSFQGLADGAYLVVGAALLLVRALTQVVDESDSRTLQLGPLAIAAVLPFLWITGERSARTAIRLWESRGGEGHLTEASLMALGGIALCGVGVAWLELRRSPDVRRRTVGLLREWDVTPARLATAAAGIVGAVAGGVAGVLLGTAVLGWAGIIITIVVALFAGLLGANLAMAVARRLVAP